MKGRRHCCGEEARALLKTWKQKQWAPWEELTWRWWARKNRSPPCRPSLGGSCVVSGEWYTGEKRMKVSGMDKLTEVECVCVFGFGLCWVSRGMFLRCITSLKQRSRGPGAILFNTQGFVRGFDDVSRTTWSSVHNLKCIIPSSY